MIGLLKDEASEVDFVGPTLPALKTLLDLPVSSEPDDKDRYSRLIHALLSACLLNIDSVRCVIFEYLSLFLIFLQWPYRRNFCEED